MERNKLINIDDHKLLENFKSQEILINEIKEEQNQGLLHLRERKDDNQHIFYQVFQSPQDDDCTLLDLDVKENLKKITEYTSYVIPFWFFFIFSPLKKVEVYYNPISFLTNSQKLFSAIQIEINSFIRKVYYRANTIILLQDLKRLQLCPSNLEIKGAQMQKQQTAAPAQKGFGGKTFLQKQFNLAAKNKPENKETTQGKTGNKNNYIVDLLDTLYFPMQEKDEISTLIKNMVFNNFGVHNTTNTYLYLEKEEIYILCFQEVNNHHLSQLDQSQQNSGSFLNQSQQQNQYDRDSFISSVQSSQPDSSFISSSTQTKIEMGSKGGSLIQTTNLSFTGSTLSNTIKEPLSQYYTLDEYQKGKKFIKIEIYGMTKKYFSLAEEGICKQVIQAQTLETTKKVGGKISDVIRISKIDYEQIQNSKQRKRFRYKFPSFIVDHASFMYYFKQNIEKIMQRFTIIHRSFQTRPQVLDQIKESQESATDLSSIGSQTPKNDASQFDKFITDNYGEMKVIKVQYDKNDFRFLSNAQSSKKIFGICMFLMNVVLQRRKQSKELEEVNHFYPVVPLKQITDNQKLGLNSIETISLGCGYSQNDWDDQSSLVYKFLAKDSQLENFKNPDVFLYQQSKYILEKNQDYKMELEQEGQRPKRDSITQTQEQYFLDLEIRNKGTLEEKKLIEYLTEMLNQISLDYLFETILQRSIVANLDEKNQNKRIQYEYFYKSCLNAEKLFHKLNHKSFFMYHYKHTHKSYHLIWPSYLKYFSSILEKDIQEKCKWNDSTTPFPALYVIDDGSGYPQIFENYNDMEICFSGNYKTSISILKKPPSISYIICGNLLFQGFREKKYDKNLLKLFEKLKEDQGVQLNPVQKQDFDIFTSRNFYGRIVISQRNLEHYFYNFNLSIIKSIAEQIDTFIQWQNCRYHVQKHVMLQKLGVYTHHSQFQPIKKKVQNQSLIDEIHKILTQEERTGDLGEIVNLKNYMRARQEDQNEKQVVQVLPKTLTNYISTMTYEIFPSKIREGMIDQFEKIYNSFLLVSFRIIKPKFTKSHYNKKLNDEGMMDTLTIHGGPFLNFVKDYYINDYNKQFFKYMRSNCSAGNNKQLDYQLVKKFLNGADQVRTDICPIIIVIADNNQFNHWKRREVDDGDVVGDHLDILEKEENRKAYQAYQVFYEIYKEQIEKLITKDYIVKQKFDHLMSNNDYQIDTNLSFTTNKRAMSQYENDKIYKYKKLTLGHFANISSLEESSVIILQYKLEYNFKYAGSIMRYNYFQHFKRNFCK